MKQKKQELNNNRDNIIFSKSCLLSYLEIVEDLLRLRVILWKGWLECEDYYMYCINILYILYLDIKVHNLQEELHQEKK